MKMQAIAISIVVSGATLGIGFALMPPGARADVPPVPPPAPAPSALAGRPAASSPAPSAVPSAAAPSLSALPASTFGLPPFASGAWGDPPSDAPKADEWKDAPRVDVTLASPAARACSTRRLREWVRIHCPVDSAGGRVLAGSPKDVTITLLPSAKGDPTLPPAGIDVTFPVRRGDPRLIELFGVGSGYEGGFFAVHGFLVDAHWPESAAAPTLVLR